MANVPKPPDPNVDIRTNIPSLVANLVGIQSLAKEQLTLTRVEAAGHLWNLCINPKNIPEIIKLGAVSQFLQLLASPNLDTRYVAVGAIQFLAVNEAAQAELPRAVPLLIELLDGPHDRSRLPAAATLSTLAPNSDLARRLAPAIPNLVKLMHRREPKWAGLDEARTHASMCLNRLVVQSEENRMAVIDAGGAEAAVRALAASEWRSPQGRAACACLLQEMAKDGPWTGDPERAAYSLVLELGGETAAAHWGLSGGAAYADAYGPPQPSGRGRDAVMAAGAIPVCVAMLRSTAELDEAKAAAGAVLWLLAATDDGIEAIRDADGIRALIGVCRGPAAPEPASGKAGKAAKGKKKAVLAPAVEAAIARAAGCLRNLALVGSERAIAGGGAVAALAPYIGVKHDNLRLSATGTLMELALANDPGTSDVLQEAKLPNYIAHSVPDRWLQLDEYAPSRPNSRPGTAASAVTALSGTGGGQRAAGSSAGSRR